MLNHPPAPSVTWRRLAVAGVAGVAVAATVSACTSANGQGSPSSHTAKTHAAGTARPSSSAAQPAAKPKPKALTVLDVSPRAGAAGVGTDAAVVVRLSTALAPSSARPKITPSVAGTWKATGSTLTFTPDAPWPSSTRITVTAPAGLVSTQGQKLAATRTASFTTTKVGTLRIQQLLAQLGYLPLAFHRTGAARTGRAAATAEAGTFAWKWSSAQSVLGGYWSAGRSNALTRSALMDFQRQHGMSTDGVAGRMTTAALVKDALAHRVDPRSYNYVHVSKATHETLTLWADGVVKFHVAVSTGITGATTYDGLFPVYAHMYFTRMRGTDVDGTKYDDKIYWASYFNGGEALHAYPRASYGFPQSNGCVEIQPANAQALWPSTPVGTPVVVTG